MATPRVVPRATGEGGIGTIAKRWGQACFGESSTATDIPFSVQRGSTDYDFSSLSALASQTTGIFTSDLGASSGDALHNRVFFLSKSGGNIHLNFGDEGDYDIGALGYDNTDNSMFFRTNNAERMTIQSDGNVGIGIATPAGSSTAGILDIKNTTTSSATEGANLRLSSDDGAVMADGHRLGVIEFAGAEDTSNTVSVGAKIESLAASTWSGSVNSGELNFYTVKNTTFNKVFFITEEQQSAFVQTVDSSLLRKTLLVDTNISGTDANEASGLAVDFVRTVPGSGTATHVDRALQIGIVSASLGTSELIGADFDVNGATSGNSTAYGLRVDVSGADTNIGLQIKNTDGVQGDDIKLISSANADDYFSISTTTDGETTITTVEDGGGSTAHLNFNIDGDLVFTPEGTVTFNTTSLSIIDDTTSSATQGGKLILGENDGAVMASGHRLGVIEFKGAEDTSNTLEVGARIEALASDTWAGSVNSADLKFYTYSGTTANNVLSLGSAQEATFLQTLDTSISTAKAVTVDANYSGDAAQDSVGLFVDFDRTVASSGTAAHNDTGIDVNVNSASLGTSSLYGMDIDVVGATSGTSSAYGIHIDCDGADSNYGLVVNTAGTHIKLEANADATNDYATISVKNTGDLEIATAGDGTTDSDITLDADGDITLDADGGNIWLADGGSNWVDIQMTVSKTVFKSATDNFNMEFRNYDDDIAAKVWHGEGTTPATNLAGDGWGLGFKMPIGSIRTSGGDVTTTLTAEHSGFVVLVDGTNNCTVVLPEIQTNKYIGMMFTFVVNATAASGKKISIKTMGASTDNNDNFLMVNHKGGSDGVEDVDGDTIEMAEGVTVGCTVRVTAILRDGVSDRWLAEVFGDTGDDVTCTDT